MCFTRLQNASAAARLNKYEIPHVSKARSTACAPLLLLLLLKLFKLSERKDIIVADDEDDAKRTKKCVMKTTCLEQF